ncbi:MAG: peptidoglycan D,D-transpeptidase FtsI family protein [Chloroflexota bacterium]
MNGRNASSHHMPVGRIHFLLILFGILVLLIIGQVIRFQIVSSEELADRATAGRFAIDEVPARRGEIFDSNGARLATNEPSARVWAILSDLEEDPESVARTLAPHLERSADEVLERLQLPDAEWVLLGQQIDAEDVQAIEELDIDGIFLEPQAGRVYPHGSFASHLLGFANYDNEGSYGIEGAYDGVIGGDPGQLVGERDGAGNLIALSPSTWDPPQDGSDVTLTIDSGVQRIIEDVLQDAIKDQNASGGTIIVQDPKTGAILGMASSPTYDPNHFDDVDDISVFSNPSISQVYEPGSTFKSIVMAIALNEGAVTPETTFDDAPGYVEVPDHPPITNNNGNVYGVQTMTEVLVRSSNLGAIFAAEQVGSDRLYKGFNQFGFGKRSGIDLEGEERGILTLPWETGWNQTLFYTNAFGQGIATTPLQVVNAYSALANGGQLMEPYLVSETHHRDGMVERREPEVTRQAISSETSAEMREMLHQVVERRYGDWVQVPGYNIGAKTGTAQVPDEEGGYRDDDTIASIVGFGPVEDPQFTVLVKIDQPRESPWGETVAGPAMAEVFSELFLLYGIPPTESIE